MLNDTKPGALASTPQSTRSPPRRPALLLFSTLGATPLGSRRASTPQSSRPNNTNSKQCARNRLSAFFTALGVGPYLPCRRRMCWLRPSGLRGSAIPDPASPPPPLVPTVNPHLLAYSLALASTMQLVSGGQSCGRVKVLAMSACTRVVGRREPSRLEVRI